MDEIEKSIEIYIALIKIKRYYYFLLEETWELSLKTLTVWEA